MIEELGFEVLLVVVFIVGAAALGFISVLLSILRMHRESAFLQEWKEKLLPKNINDVQKTLRAWYQAEKESPREAKTRSRYHLSKRVDTMLQALENDPTKAKELPELHDLHELTLQDELGYASSATLRTVISFLLILGILGTLTGVHSVVLNDAGAALTRAMASALLPSMLAVGSTVVLMLLRGVYSAKVDAFLEELDFYTMTVLSPRLQPASDTQRNKGELKKAIDTFSKNADKIKTASDELKEHTGELSKGIQAFSEAMAHMQSLVQDAESLESSFEQEASLDIANLTTRMQTLESNMKSMEKANGNMADHIAVLREKGMNAKAGYDQLHRAIELAGTRLSDSLAMVNQLTETSGELKNYAEIITLYDDRLTKLFEQKQSISDIYTAVLADVTQVQSNHEQAQVVSNEVYQSAIALDAASESMHEFVTKQYNIDADKRTVAGKLEAVHKGVSDLHKSQNHLANAFRNRARKIGITE